MMLHSLASMTLTAMLAASLAAQEPTGFLDRTVKSGALELRYQVYVPPTYDGHRSLPVILFLHGSGERGSDGIKQTQVGMPSQIRWHRDWFDAIVGAEDTERHKPEPDVFLEAARRLGLEPAGCVVFEDSDLGLEAAARAGMAGVDIRDWLA